MKKVISGEATYDSETNQITSPNEDVKSLIIKALQDEEISNIIGCIKSTSHFINDDSEKDSELSQEFINRWRNEARLLSEESLQYVWGRILAEEINTPRTISVRTLDVLKNLSKEEAEYFSEAIDFIIYDSILLDNEDLRKPFISADKVHKLRDAGLIVSFTPGYYHQGPWETQEFVIDGTVIPKVFYISNCDKYFFINAEKTDNIPKIVRWELTNAGRELYSILRKEHKTKDSSVKRFIEWMLNNNTASEFYCGDIIKNSDNSHSVYNVIPVSTFK